MQAIACSMSVAGPAAWRWRLLRGPSHPRLSVSISRRLTRVADRRLSFVVGDAVAMNFPAATAAVRRAYFAGAPDGPRSMAATVWAACGVVP